MPNNEWDTIALVGVPGATPSVSGAPMISFGPPPKPKQCRNHKPHPHHRWPTTGTDPWRHECAGVRCAADEHDWLDETEYGGGWTCSRCGTDWELEYSPLNVACWLLAEARWWARVAYNERLVALTSDYRSIAPRPYWPGWIKETP